MNAERLRSINRQSSLAPIDGAGLRGVVSDEAAAELAARNKARAEAAIAALGSGWALAQGSTSPSFTKSPKGH